MTRSIPVSTVGLVCICLPLFLLPGSASAQIPDEFTNLQVLPQDLTRDELLQVMRRFSLDLGVRCQYCHVGGDGVAFEGVVFESDDDPDKVKARRMLEMVGQLNNEFLASLPDRDDPEVEIGCKTCHRGRPRPVLLSQELRIALDEAGPDLAIERYEQYRDDMTAGMFDFGEWEVNLLAEDLTREGRVTDAIAIYELNARYFPQSVGIHLSLGGLYETNEDIPAAVASYRRVLELNPGNAAATARLQAIGGTPKSRL